MWLKLYLEWIYPGLSHTILLPAVFSLVLHEAVMHSVLKKASKKSVANTLFRNYDLKISNFNTNKKHILVVKGNINRAFLFAFYIIRAFWHLDSY